MAATLARFSPRSFVLGRPVLCQVGFLSAMSIFVFQSFLGARLKIHFYLRYILQEKAHPSKRGMWWKIP